MTKPADLSYCAQRVRRHDYERYLCALFAPPERREALMALYAFNLEVASIREMVSEPLIGHMRLQWWRDSLDAVYGGVSANHPIVEALGQMIHRHDLTRSHFETLLDARAFDLEDDVPADVKDLEAYAEGTSATLVALALEILGATDGAAGDAGRHVGIAWALTGLLRAIPFHASTRRVYLPADLSREAGLDLADLCELRPTPGLNDVVSRIAAVARDHLAAARRHRGRVGKQALPALLPATLATRHLNRLQRAGFDPFAYPPHDRGPWRLVRLAATAWRGRY